MLNQDSGLSQSLLEFENIEETARSRMKVGVLFCDVGQTQEIPMFSNLEGSEGIVLLKLSFGFNFFFFFFFFFC
jgi:hypothetical protein